MVERKLSGRLEKIQTELEVEEKTLKERLGKLDEERNVVLSDLNRIEKLLATLSDKAANGKPRAAGKMAGFTKAEIQNLVEHFLKDGKTLTEDELKRLLLEKAREAGKTGKGLPVLMRHALKSERFSGASGRYELAK